MYSLLFLFYLTFYTVYSDNDDFIASQSQKGAKGTKRVSSQKGSGRTKKKTKTNVPTDNDNEIIVRIGTIIIFQTHGH